MFLELLKGDKIPEAEGTSIEERYHVIPCGSEEGRVYVWSHGDDSRSLLSVIGKDEVRVPYSKPVFCVLGELDDIIRVYCSPGGDKSGVCVYLVGERRSIGHEDVCYCAFTSLEVLL